jgi:hypothetical protein
MTALDYVVEKESEIIERIENQSHAPEWVRRYRERDIARANLAIDLLRSVMGK